MVKVSISIPTYNRLDLLKKCLASVFNQTVPPDEIIVVDDFSKDGTWEYIKKLKGVKAYRNKKNLGMIGNWNESIRLAKNQFVVSLHSDDIVLPDYIKDWKEKISSLKNRDNIAAFISDGYIIDINGKVTAVTDNFNKDSLFKPPQTIKKWWKNHYFCIPVTGWTVFNKRIIESIGGFSGRFGLAAENEITMRVLPDYPVFFSKSLNFCYRRHEFQSFQGKTTAFDFAKEIKNTVDALRVYQEYGQGTVEIPSMYLLVVSVINLLGFNFYKFRVYLGIFISTYPSGIPLVYSVKIFFVWTKKIIIDYLRNRKIYGKKI